MTNKIPEWMTKAATELSEMPELAEVDSDDLEGWEFNIDLDEARLTEAGDYGEVWVVSNNGHRLTLEWGSIDFGADVQGDIADEARRLLNAAREYNEDPATRRPDRVDLGDDGRPDDVFFSRPRSIHIESMGHRHWWAGIQLENGEEVMLDWYLEDVEGKKKKGLHLRVEGGPNPTKPKEEGT